MDVTTDGHIDMGEAYSRDAVEMTLDRADAAWCGWRERPNGERSPADIPAVVSPWIDRETDADGSPGE